MTKRVLLYFALLLWFVVPVTAQPTIFIEDQSVDPNTSTTVDVKISGFLDILSVQFSVNWDSDMLQFDSISIDEIGVLPDLNASNFGTTNSHLGRFTTSWFNPSLVGVEVEDSSTIFTIHYQVLGDPGTSSDVGISDDPLAIEISYEDGTVLDISDITLENGTVNVLQAMAVENLLVQSNQAFTLYQNEPNPFDNQTVIRFDVNEASDFVLEVYDSKGALIHAHNDYYLTGSQSITIDKEILPAIGTYFYKLKTKDYFITNRMILVR